ncbi:FAD-dependent oxidoreductase [Paraburkholderia caribensis]|uniref:FAD-dependent oxidoreductase n=1 Tax=Paraburkholderia caribensis TaxID=75105 RepID=A0A9Q6WNA5_9BURK|nr:FAD-dependent oxidoreductase [Paraburkholderia caribensis]MCO4883131.1 FAD-dependent oxidoreductase [Paraburkholderia caribensis]PTB28827.1 FAD/NAD(P)-binding oxidoreductase [Paraburkholderia caribensis]QLB64654.1 FAD/NAD(P)-binding oxidoreductase [Paraburkholderia caribensis]
MNGQRFDVVVVGAGPAGLAAACEAATTGARVAVLDDNPRAGGQVWRTGPAHPPSDELAARLHEIQASGNVTLASAARVIAPLDKGRLLIESAEHGGACIGYDRLILATGARELLLPFDGWTLPGVTGAGGLQALIKGGVPVRGERIVIAGSGPLLLASLATARAAGARVVAVVEQASLLSVMRFGVSLAATPAKLVQAAQLTRGLTGLRYLTSSVVRAAKGSGRVERAIVERADGRIQMFDCDRIACGYGLVPDTTLARALGCATRADGAIAVDGAQRTSVANIFAAGECAGVGGMELARVEGRIAGRAALGLAQAETFEQLRCERARWQRFAARVEMAFALRDPARQLPADDTLLCRCEDVSVGEVRAHASWRDAKLHTRCAMGACQGRICGGAAQALLGWDVTQVRPPIRPAQIATLMLAADENTAAH